MGRLLYVKGLGELCHGEVVVCERIGRRSMLRRTILITSSTLFDTNLSTSIILK